MSLYFTFKVCRTCSEPSPSYCIFGNLYFLYFVFDQFNVFFPIFNFSKTNLYFIFSIFPFSVLLISLLSFLLSYIYFKLNLFSSGVLWWIFRWLILNIWFSSTINIWSYNSSSRHLLYLQPIDFYMLCFHFHWVKNIFSFPLALSFLVMSYTELYI